MRSVRPGRLVKGGECARIEGRPGDRRPAVSLCIVAQGLTIRFCRVACVRRKDGQDHPGGPRVWVCCAQAAVASSRAMPAAQSSISGQSRKSPSGRAARAARSLRSERSAKVSFLGSSAPKKTC